MRFITKSFTRMVLTFMVLLVVFGLGLLGGLGWLVSQPAQAGLMTQMKWNTSQGYISVGGSTALKFFIDGFHNWNFKGGKVACNGVVRNTKLVSANYNVQSVDDIIVVDTTAAVVGLYFPDATVTPPTTNGIVPGQVWTVKDIQGNFATHNCFLYPSGSQKLDNAASVTLSTNWQVYNVRVFQGELYNL